MPQNLSDPVYLGDSVYAHFDGFHIVLTTNNGSGPSNEICLDSHVVEAFLHYQKRLDANIVEAMNLQYLVNEMRQKADQFPFHPGVDDVLQFRRDMTIDGYEWRIVF